MQNIEKYYAVKNNTLRQYHKRWSGVENQMSAIAGTQGIEAYLEQIELMQN